MSNVKYSFIIPVKNGEKSIAHTIESIQKQTYTDFELIVVNNGSTDNTKKILKSFSSLLCLDCKKIGRSVARNYGAKKANGDILVFVDADVILEPDWLEKSDQYISQYKCDALATSIIPYHEDGGVADLFRTAFIKWKSHDTFLSLQKRKGPLPVINTAACLVSSKSFFAVHGFDESLKRNEDLNLSLKLFRMGYLLGGTTSAKAYVRFLANSSLPYAREAAYLRRCFDVHYHSVLPNSRLSHFSGIYLWAAMDYQKRFDLAAYAMLIELASYSGHLASKALSKKQSVKRQFASGPKSLCFSFGYRDDIYFLKPQIRLMLIDQSVHLFRQEQGGESEKIAANQAGPILKLISKEKLSKTETVNLIKMGIFENVGNNKL